MKNLRNTIIVLLTLTVVGGGLLGFFTTTNEAQAAGEFIQTMPTNQTITQGENAVFTTGINPAHTDLTYQWYGTVPSLNPGGDGNEIDNHDETVTIPANGGYIVISIDPTKIAVGSVVSFDYDMPEDVIPDCATNHYYSFNYSFSFNGASKDRTDLDLCTPGSGRVEYVIQSDDLPPEWSSSPLHNASIFIYYGYSYNNLPLTGPMTISNFSSALYQTKFIPIKSSNSPTLTITPSSQFYRDGAEFAMMATNLAGNKEVTPGINIYGYSNGETGAKLTITGTINDPSVNSPSADISVGPSVIPGVPNTGLSENADFIILFAILAAASLVSIILISRKLYSRR